MTYVFLDSCTACGACLLTCPEHAIVAQLPLVVREDRCTSCGECVEVCPADAVLEVRVPPADRLRRGAPPTPSLTPLTVPLALPLARSLADHGRVQGFRGMSTCDVP